MYEATKRWFLAAILLMLVPGWVQASTPDELVRETAGRILAKIDAHYDDYRADPKLLGEVVRSDLLPLLDMRYAARLILGRAGRGASDEQIDAFTEAMTGLLIDRYSAGLMEFRSSEQLQVMPLRGEPNERATRVRTRVQLDSGRHIPVDYVFHKTDNGWRVFDVIIEGISYVSTYRNQIIPEIEASSLNAVTQRIATGELVLED